MSADTDTIAARLAVRGIGWSVRQEASLLLRHWWPLTALGVFTSERVRRVLLTALVVDFLVMLAEQPESRREPATYLAGRRLDDIAYGAGLWWGTAKARSVRVLVPRRPGRV